jgi:hypothetical protein
MSGDAPYVCIKGFRVGLGSLDGRGSLPAALACIKPCETLGFATLLGPQADSLCRPETRKGSRCPGAEGAKSRGVCCGRRSTRAGNYFSKVLYIVTLHRP